MHSSLSQCSRRPLLFTVVAIIFTGTITKAEDGYRLWLRYDRLQAVNVTSYRTRVRSIMAPGSSSIIDAARRELVNGCTGLLGQSVPTASRIEGDGVILLGTPRTSTDIASLHLERQLAALGPE